MNNGFRLLKIYLINSYGLNRFLGDLKYNKKRALKSIALILLILLSFSSLIGTYYLFNEKVYHFLKPIGQEGLLITISLIIASVITFIFGIITVISNYFLQLEGSLILALPIKKTELLLAKFLNTYLLEFLFALVILAIGLGVYGLNEKESMIFYLLSLIVALFVPIIPLVISYFIVVPIMKIGNFTKKKDLFMIIAGLLAILLGLAYQYFINSLINLSSNQEELMRSLVNRNGLVNILGQIYYPSLLVSRGLINYDSFAGLAYLLVFIILAITLFVFMLSILAEFYYSSIIGSDEVSKRTKEKNDHRINFPVRPLNQALLIREIKLMLREPIYLLNGPLVILILPIILIFTISFNSAKMNQLFTLINNQTVNENISIIVGLIIMIMSSLTSITSTAISREGKAFYFVKSLPIKPMSLIMAKFHHGFIYGILVSLLTSIFLLYLKFSIIEVLISIIIGLLLLANINFLGLIFELLWPKLIWDSPQKAMKQNMNSFFIFLINFLIAYLSYFLIWDTSFTFETIFLIFLFVPLITLIIIYQVLKKYSVNLFNNI